jgi:hypothetical protein
VKLRPGPTVAVVLLAALGVTTWLLEFRGADERRKSEAAKEKPLAFERADLKAIVLRGAKESVRLERNGETWTITEPLASAADRDAVEGLLAALETAKINRRLGVVADRKPYALDPPSASITLETSGGGSQTLGIGDANPIGGTLFVLLPGGKEVAVVSGSIGEAARKDLQALRDKALLAFDPWKITRLTLERGAETVALEKPADGWKLVRPVETPADGPTVTDLLSAVERLRALRFVTEKATDADMKSFALEPPAARLTLQQEGWDAARTILFGGVTEGNRYARTVGRDAVVTVNADIWAKVTTSVFDLRRKEVLGLSQYRLASVTVARDGGPALVLRRQKDGPWAVSGRAQGNVKNDSVDTLVRLIADVKALAFEDQPMDSRLAALSQRPPLDLTLEQEPDTEGTTARHQHLLFGAAGKDGRVPVRDMAWHTVSLVDGSALGKINDQLETLVKEATTPAVAPAAPVPPGGPAAPAPGGTAPPGGAPAPTEPPSSGGRD